MVIGLRCLDFDEVRGNRRTGKEFHITEISTRLVPQPMLFPCRNTNHLSLAESDLLAFDDFRGLPAQGNEHGFSILVKMIRDFAAGWEHSKKPAQILEQVLAGQDLNPVRFLGD